MGGLSFSRHRHKGCIEGYIKKLLTKQEKIPWRTASSSTTPTISKLRAAIGKIFHTSTLIHQRETVKKPQKDSNAKSGVQSSTGPTEKKRKRVRRLGKEFDRIATKLLKIMSNLAFTHQGSREHLLLLVIPPYPVLFLRIIPHVIGAPSLPSLIDNVRLRREREREREREN
ncbi:hypothetical protein ZIOFF_029629 [Zingiber officinale]|uniref:Uncharacterized protein n=1 Tax=Zingiber officinale TaxID=94328 RepID=A0A8J5LEI5_ZINOF|nr:hypothetical protein ZIOFF_029629 [Zingiber officinale]